MYLFSSAINKQPIFLSTESMTHFKNLALLVKKRKTAYFSI